MKIAVCQIDTVLGDIGRNLEKVIDFSEKAVKNGAKVALFPELSLTGYYLQDITIDVAIKKSSDVLLPLKRLSKEIDIVIGCIEETDSHVLYNSAFYLSGGEVKHVHKKVYLPTYGMFDEGRFVGAGKEFSVFDSNGVTSSVMICEDCWHFSSFYTPFLKGAKLFLVQSASPGRGYKSEGCFDNSAIWKNMGEFYSRLTGSYFIYSNRVGVEDGLVFSGNSFICDPFGDVIAEASPFDEEIIFGEIKEAVIRAARLNLPLLRDEKPEVVLKGLDSYFEGRK